MAVDDLWFLRARDPVTKKRLKSRRYGRGKRWRVRWTDPDTGESRTELFERQADAERHDANMLADISRGVYVDPRSGRITVADYAETWRHQQLHRDSTEERVERALRLHVTPLLGKLPMSSVRASHMRGWVKDRSKVLSPVTLRGVFQAMVVPMFSAAVIDRVIGVSPCLGVKLPDVEAPDFYIATPEQVHTLAEALPARYRAAAFVAAGCGWRAGEVFGLELGQVDFLRREVRVLHQLKVVVGRQPFLGLPKTKTSKRINELPEVVGNALARHIEQFPPVPIEIDDDTDPRNSIRREARLVFPYEGDRLMYRAQWSKVWRPAVEKAGLPAGFGMRDLRHYFATCLIFGGANVKSVQLAMGHSTPTVTLNTYVGLWPDAVDRTRSLVDAALGSVSGAASVAIDRPKEATS